MAETAKIYEEIARQQQIGFSADEIRTNLLAQHYTHDEITAALKTARVTEASAAKKSGGASVLSVLVSIYFIFNGCMKMSKAPSGSFLYTWGIIMLCVGIAGGIWKISDLARSR